MAATTRSHSNARNGSTDGSSRRAKRPSPQPRLGQRGPELQPFGKLRLLPIALASTARSESCRLLNEVLADTTILYALYKKAHWNVAGPTFYQLHLLFDKHYGEQNELVDELAERVQQLGGVSVAMAHDVVELTRIPRAPRGREDAAAQIARLLEAHELILRDARRAARAAAESGDDGTNDLLVSDVVRTNEMQVWFISEHLVPTTLTQVDGVE